MQEWPLFEINKQKPSLKAKKENSQNFWDESIIYSFTAFNKSLFIKYQKSKISET